MNQVELAEVIARMAHAGQARWDGESYIEHPLRVAKALSMRPGGAPLTLYAAALLHDVVEDTEYGLGDLERFGVHQEVRDLVEAVTRRGGESYADFIERVAASPRNARALKLADIKDNLRTLPDRHSLRGRYEKALLRLEGSEGD